MYKIETNFEINNKILAKNTKIGDLMKITDTRCTQTGDILLHTFDGFVSLSDPIHTWEESCLLEVELLPEGTVITLTV